MKMELAPLYSISAILSMAAHEWRTGMAFLASTEPVMHLHLYFHFLHWTIVEMCAIMFLSSHNHGSSSPPWREPTHDPHRLVWIELTSKTQRTSLAVTPQLFKSLKEAPRDWASLAGQGKFQPGWNPVKTSSRRLNCRPEVSGSKEFQPGTKFLCPPTDLSPPPC